MTAPDPVARPPRLSLRALGRILISGFAAAGGTVGARSRPFQEESAAAAPRPTGPPPNHPERVVPHAALGRAERRWWSELERRLDSDC